MTITSPYYINTGNQVTGVPTWQWPRSTQVNIEVIGGGNGHIRFQCGLSPNEDNDVHGRGQFSRCFGGGRLTTTNIGSSNLKVWTA
ncbi:hypothetical protein ACTFIU_007328 [Dictyostelium citrinum]